MNAPTSVCPVPFEQQPINEFNDLQTSWFFCWATLDISSYGQRLAWVWGLSWLITGPVAAASFAPAKYPGQFLLSSAVGAEFFLFLVLLRLYLGWRYIRDRLLQETVWYEESGWYDGQTWLKPPEVLTRDRLIVSYQIQPLLQRLQRTFLVLLGTVSLVTLVWQAL